MINNVLLYLVLLIPPALVSGPFISDLLLSISGLIILYLIIKKRLWYYFNNKFFLLFFIFYLYLVLRSFFAENILLSLESSLFYFRYIFFCFAIVYLSENIKNFYKYFFLSISITLFAVFADASMQFFIGKNSLGYSVPNQAHYISGFFGDEKILGSFFVRLTPIFLFLYFILYRDNFYSNLILIIFFIISFFIAIISGERTSVLLIILFYVCLIISLNKMIFFRLTVFLITILIFSLISFLTIKVIQNPDYLQVSDHSSPYKKYEKLLTRNIKQTITQLGLRENKNYYFSKVHQSHYDSALKMFKDNIFFGHGPKMFRVLCAEKKYHSVYGKNKFGNFIHCSTHPHNTYIQLLAETGIIGFIFPFLIFILSMFSLGKNVIYKLSNNNSRLSNSLMCLILCMFINFWPIIPTGNFFNNWISIFYYLPIAFYLSKHLKKYSKT